ncbi:MAG TPA: alpha-1,2-fucosyltransferase [Ignavibacteria bacterium]
MIITKINSGLGNQLFQYAASRAISIRSNATLKLDITFYESDTIRKYRLNQFNVIENLATGDEIELYKTEEAVKKTFFKKVLNRMNSSGIEYVGKNHIKEKPWVNFEPSVLKLKDNFYLEGYWQNQSYFKSIRKTLLEEFTLKYPVDNLTRGLLEKVRNCNSVSLHIRRGDYLDIALFNVLSLEYYHAAMSFIKKKVDKPFFFVFSDDISWAKKHLNHIENVLFIDQQGNESEILELEIMKNCDHNIIANSTFSWWGAWLNQNQGKIIIAPHKWSHNRQFQRNQDENEFIPAAWIRL